MYSRFDATSPNGQPARRVAIERRRVTGRGAAHPVAHDQRAGGAELGGAAGDPASRPHPAASARRPQTGHVRPSVRCARPPPRRRTAPCRRRRPRPRWSARTLGRQPEGRAGEHGARLVADQRDASRGRPVRARRAVRGRRTKPTSTSSRSVRSSRVSTTARSACGAEHDHAARVSGGVDVGRRGDVDDGQVGQRSRHPSAAEAQHRRRLRRSTRSSQTAGDQVG